MSKLTFDNALDLIKSANAFGDSSSTLNGHLLTLKEQLARDFGFPTDFFDAIDIQHAIEHADDLATFKNVELTLDASKFYKEVALDIGYMWSFEQFK